MKRIRLTFIITIFCIMILPILLFNRKGVVAQKENRKLAVFPCVVQESHLNQRFFSQCSSYLEDRFGGREKLSYLASKVRYKILRAEVMNEKAILGKDGWWFYINASDGANLDDFYKRNLLNENDISSFRKKISETIKWCSEHGIKTMFIIGPNKHSVYEEFFPFGPRPSGITRADQICSVFRELSADYVFPRDYMISKKSDSEPPLYWETDIHWNPLGAFYASDLVKAHIKALFPGANFPAVEYESEIITSNVPGDIPPMLKLPRPRVTYKAIPKNWKKLQSVYTYETPDMSSVGSSYDEFHGKLRDIIHDVNGMRTKNKDKSLPRAIVFRDSFFRALEPFVSPMFSETEYIWRQFSDSEKAHILEYKPDIIIFESVERYAPDIVR